MHLRPLLIANLTASLFVLSPFVAGADPDIRYQMLVSGQIDRYPTDDDVIAISRYLTAVGDRQLDVPSAIADWIQGQIGQLGPTATPRLITAYMHFLRKGAIAPPFDGGAPGSPRNRLLLAMARDLQSRPTPLANLALLMFAESNDAAQRRIQAAGDYSPLRSFSWAVGRADWMDWILVGLRPDTSDTLPAASWRSPDFPVVTNLAKAGLLRKVQAFFSAIDVRPPVSASVMNFVDLTDYSHSWGHLGRSHIPRPDPSQLLNQASALAILLSHRYANTFGLSPVSDDSVSANVSTRYHLGGDMVTPNQLEDLYGTALGFAETGLNLRLTRLSNVVYSQQFRLLALSALALADYRRSHNEAAQDIPMDAVFSQLAATMLPASESKTTIVVTLDPADLQAASRDDAALSQCKPKSASVVRRQISIQDRNFVEVFDAQCTAGGTVRLNKSGTLSTDFARLFEINPNWLDMLKLSLAFHSLKAGAYTRGEDPEDVDLVRVKPKLATALIVAALAHPEIPWHFVRDALLQDWPPAIEWFVPGWRPPSAALQQYARPMQVVSLEDADFQGRQTAAFQRQMNYLQFETQWHFFHGVAPTVNAMKAVENNCGNFLFDFLSFGGCCGYCTDTGKKALAAKLDQIGAQANSVGVNSRSLLDHDCVAARDHADDARLIAIDFNTQHVASSYITGLCDFPVGGGISDVIPQPVQDALKHALQQDPIFLNRYQLDIMPSYDGWDTQLAAALTYSSQETIVAPQFMSFLQANDLLYYLPSIPVPTPSPNWWDTSQGQTLTVGLVFASPLDAMTVPLMRSREGMDLAQDLAVLQRLTSWMPTPPEAKRRQISNTFMRNVRSLEQSVLAAQYAKVDVQVNDFKAKMNAHSNNFVIGFSLAFGGGTVPGLFFEYNGVGVNATLPIPNVVLIAPVLGPWQLPTYPLILSSPPPLPSSLNLPSPPNLLHPR